MSTTRSQKRRNDQQESDRNVSEGLVSPIVMENPCSSNQDVEVAGPSGPKSPRIKNSLLENLRASLREEITSEIENLLIESQKEMLELLKPKTRENVRDNFDEETENETRNFYTPTKSVRIISTQNDPIVCRNTPFNFFHFFQPAGVSQNPKGPPFTILSLRYSADFGRSRLVSTSWDFFEHF